MKKQILLYAVLIALLFSIPARAISYRGFLDVGGGYTLQKFPYQRMAPNISFTTTHGIQAMKNLYVGVGLGINLQRTDLNTKLFGIYADIRWDGFGVFGMDKRISPFIDLKIGCQYALSYEAEGNGWSYDSVREELFIEDAVPVPQEYFDVAMVDGYMLIRSLKHPGGLFIRPTIGIRIGLSSLVGLNIGFYADALNFIRMKKVTGELEGTFSYTDMNSIIHTYSIDYTFLGATPIMNAFGISVGIDF